MLEISTVGLAFTNTEIVLLASHPFAATNVAVYIPSLSAVAFGIEIVFVEAENPFGPVHEYVPDVLEFATSAIVAPSQYEEAPSIEIVGISASAVIVIDASAVQLFSLVTTTV